MPVLVFAQFTDDFSDGNFSSNPPWMGNTEKFQINEDFILQLNDSDAGDVKLFTASNKATNCEWRFWIKLAFSPSANNNARVYLIADDEDYLNSGNAYYLQFGESGSDDAMELFRQDAGESISICRGEEGIISSSFELGVKVIRDENGLWQICADENGGENYKFQAEGSDSKFTNSSYFGISCKYTSSNSSKFYFDNFYCGDIYIDEEPPQLLSINVLNDSSLNLVFDEVLEITSVENTNNYKLINENEHPVSAILDAESETEVKLIFNSHFISGETNSLSVENIRDISGNSMQKQEFDFMYFLAQPFDLLINEIMADPSPVVNLPEYEYLEIYNSLPFAVNLQDWVLQIGASEKTFENIEIDANGYLIVAKEEVAEEFSEYGRFYGFSSFSLPNGGQDLKLISREGDLIYGISYEGDWYNDEEKMYGGWSLEMINHNNICSAKENFTASNSLDGGTPGSQNSVNSHIIFYPAPIKLEMLDNNKIQIYFNQAMDSLSATDKSNYGLQGETSSAFTTYFSGFKPDKLILTFEDEFEKQKVYYLILKKGLQNCSGLEMHRDTSIAFGIAEISEPGDIVINEILFNPLGDGVDFVELYNNSFKIFDFSQLQLASVRNSPPNPPDTSYYDISTESEMFMPGTYMCLTSSPQMVKSQYYSSNPMGFIKMESFPSFSNEEGVALLINENNVLLDSLYYNEDMHFPLLNYVDG
ncbi:MAG: hypothetical protein C0598_05415, partial [Marinilabiliales bacterium]